MVVVERNKVILLDFQFVFGNNEQIFIKELAFMNGGSVVPNYYLFKSPYHFKELDKAALRKYYYCKKYVNGLDWKTGCIEYLNVADILSPLNNATIIVVGKAKKEFLEKFLSSNIINIELNTSLCKLPNYFANCPIHRNFDYRCVLNNVFKILYYLEKNEYDICI